MTDWLDNLPTKCGKCLEYYFSNPYLVEACASVGIEKGKTTEEMLVEYLAQYHNDRHKELK